MEKVKKYFERIGLELPEQIVPDSALLKKLQFAHCTTVPYENLDILRQIPLSLEPEALYEKVVVQGKSWAIKSPSMPPAISGGRAASPCAATGS